MQLLKLLAFTGLLVSCVDALLVYGTEVFKSRKKVIKNLDVLLPGKLTFWNSEKLSTVKNVFIRGDVFIRSEKNWASPSGVTEIYLDAENIWQLEMKLALQYLDAKTEVKARIECKKVVRLKGRLELEFLGLPAEIKAQHRHPYDLTIAAGERIENMGVVLVQGGVKNPILLEMVIRGQAGDQAHFLNNGQVCLRHAAWEQQIDVEGHGYIMLGEGAVFVLDSRHGFSRSAKIFMDPGAAGASLVCKHSSQKLTRLNVKGLRAKAYIRFDPPVSRFEYVNGVLHFYGTDDVEALQLKVGFEYTRDLFEFRGNYITYNGPVDVQKPRGCRCVKNLYSLLGMV